MLIALLIFSNWRTYILLRTGLNLISKSDKYYITTTKTRIISQNQQLMRIDNEIDIKKNIKKNISISIEKLIKNSDAVIFSDYNKGSLKNVTELIKMDTAPGYSGEKFSL